MRTIRVYSHGTLKSLADRKMNCLVIRRLTGGLGSTVKAPRCEVSVSTRDKVFNFSGTQFPHLQDSINNNSILTSYPDFRSFQYGVDFEEHRAFAALIAIIVNIG